MGTAVWTNRDKFVGIVQRKWEKQRGTRGERVAQQVSNNEVPTGQCGLEGTFHQILF
jgi:hypothetical protein